MIVMGGGYYYYGAITPLKSLYAYREIHDVLERLQKKSNISPANIDLALSELYPTLPQTEFVHAKMGEVYLALNLFSEAKMAYQQALKINGTNRDYLYGVYYAESLMHQGKLAQSSVQVLTKMRESFPKDNGILNLLAVNSFQTNQYDQAINYWKQIESSSIEEISLIQEMINRALINLPHIKLKIQWHDPHIKKYPVIFLVVKHPNHAMPILVKKLVLGPEVLPGQTQEYILSNHDAMDPHHGISAGQKLKILVRGSVSGLADKSNADKIVASRDFVLKAEALETKIIF